jgi:MarR family transcriptional regulator, temperature-dependent positive regulator of motility
LYVKFHLELNFDHTRDLPPMSPTLTRQPREKSRTRSKPATTVAAGADAVDELHPMIATKLWSNPCWLSFRANYIAHHYNQPIYEWIWRTYRVTAAEHVVLYAVGLKAGVTADDVAASSARPKNTLSRAINALIAKRFLTRVQDASDRRRLHLHLTQRGRKIVAETVPVLVRHEEAMFAALSVNEQKVLKNLLTKIVLSQMTWPTRIVQEELA